METPRSITQLLRAWNGGDPQALAELIPQVYDQLRRIARQQARRLPGQTLQTTDLIHEAYTRLAALEEVAWQDRQHFFAACARMIRFILIDRLRRRERHAPVPVDEVEQALPTPAEDLPALDEALSKLEKLDKQQCLIVELRYFVGLTIEQTAEVLQVSPATVKRAWQQARRWLKAEIAGGLK